MVRLILIRHGETNYNTEKKYCGFSNPPLNEKGVWQAEKLSERMNDIKIDKIYSSDLTRAKETSRIIFGKRLLIDVAEFREMNFGIFEGLRHEEIMQKYSEIYRLWINDPLNIKIPQGEKLEELAERVRNKLSVILSQHEGETLAIIAHSGPLRIILFDALRINPEIPFKINREDYLDINVKTFWTLGIENCSLNILDYSSGIPQEIVNLNDTIHLKREEIPG